METQDEGRAWLEAAVERALTRAKSANSAADRGGARLNLPGKAVGPAESHVNARAHFGGWLVFEEDEGPAGELVQNGVPAVRLLVSFGQAHPQDEVFAQHVRVQASIAAAGDRGAPGRDQRERALNAVPGCPLRDRLRILGQRMRYAHDIRRARRDY